MSARERISIVQGDITEMDVDAVVNAANTELVLGSGVAGAIRRKGGPSIQQECDRIGAIPLGEAAITTGGKLKARHVIHAASMSFTQLTTEQSLKDSTFNSLVRAEEKKLRSIAFPAIGTGVAGFPVQRCAQIILTTAREYLDQHPGSSLEEILFVLYDENTYTIFNEQYNQLQ